MIGAGDGDIGSWILAHGYAVVMVLPRIAGICALLPGIGEATTPPAVKAGMMLALALLLFPAVQPLLPPAPASGTGLAGMLLAELANGLWFGWLARVIAGSLALSGQFIAGVSGFSNVLMPSAESGAETTAIARLHEAAVPLLILNAGLYMPLLRAFDALYRTVPPGTLFWPEAGAAAALAAIAASFELAVRLAGPFVIAGVAWQCVAGIAARLEPRMQVYFVAIPGQIALSLILLSLMAAPILGLWVAAMRGAFPALPGVR